MKDDEVSMVTAYDYSQTVLVEKSGIEMVLGEILSQDDPWAFRHHGSYHRRNDRHTLC